MSVRDDLLLPLPQRQSAGPVPGASAPGLAPSTLQTLAGLGIDPGMIAGLVGGASTADPDDPDVYLGPDGARPPLVSKGRTSKLSALNAKFYALSPSELIAFQRRMAAAGLLKNPRYGDFDEDSYSLWSGINERAARFHAVGVKRTPNDVMDMVTAAAASTPEAESATPGDVERLVSPLDLESQIQTAARSRLNRKMTPKQVADFLAVYDGIQRRDIAQTRLASDIAQPVEGADGQEVDGRDSVITAAPSPGAAADQFIDSGFAQEAAGQDSYRYLQALQQMLGGSA